MIHPVYITDLGISCLADTRKQMFDVCIYIVDIVFSYYDFS